MSPEPKYDPFLVTPEMTILSHFGNLIADYMETQGHDVWELGRIASRKLAPTTPHVPADALKASIEATAYWKSRAEKAEASLQTEKYEHNATLNQRDAWSQEAQSHRWIPCSEKLPPMFENVLVWGRQVKDNICAQAWQARRWTGCTQGFDVEKDKLWDWIAPCDYLIAEVSHWMPLPRLPDVPTPPKVEPENPLNIGPHVNQIAEEVSKVWNEDDRAAFEKWFDSSPLPRDRKEAMFLAWLAAKQEGAGS